MSEEDVLQPWEECKTCKKEECDDCLLFQADIHRIIQLNPPTAKEIAYMRAKKECPKCKRKRHSPLAVFCSACGERLEVTDINGKKIHRPYCNVCKEAGKCDAKFCSTCGRFIGVE